MLRGLYIGATGMNVQAKRMEVISNDIANASTTGYKKDTAVVSSFREELYTRLNDQKNNVPNNRPIGTMTLGAKINEVFTDYSQGSLIKTDNMVDLAIQGDGFFVVQTPNGERYTRDGSFVINSQGALVTKEGYAVMGQDGPINFDEEFMQNGGEVTIKEDGQVLRGLELIDTLNLVSFENNNQLVKLNDNLYEGQGARLPFTGTLMQGYVEAANVNPVTAMVDMITVSRAYEANQKVVQTYDQLLGKAVNEVGRL